MRLMVMQHYLDEELFITRDGVAVAYLRTGPKASELLCGKTNVSFSPRLLFPPPYASLLDVAEMTDAVVIVVADSFPHAEEERWR